MGMDIHLHIVKDGKVVASDIFDGRNSEWFRNLQGNGWDDIYDELPKIWGFSDQAPAEFEERYTKEKGYFDFFHVNVKDFKDWFMTYHPDIDAGWVTTYEKWQIENRGFVPEDMKHYLDKDDVLADMYFVQVTNKYDCSAWLYNYLVDNQIDDQADITYWFDC